MLKSADIVVIGGGITGCAVLYELSRACLGQVVLVESGRMAGATTGESGGYTRRFNLDPQVCRLSSESFDYYQNFDREVGGSCGFVRTGLTTRVSMSMLSKAFGQIEELKSAGHQILISTKAPKHSLSMPAHADNGTAFIYEPGLGYIDTKLTCLNWLEAASKYGAQACEYTKVLNIVFDNDSVAGVVTDKGVIKSKVVVLAAGAWSCGLLNKLPLDTEDIDARSFQYNIYLGAAKHMDTAFMDNVAGFYIAPSRDGNVFAGILNENRLVENALLHTAHTNVNAQKLYESLGYEWDQEYRGYSLTLPSAVLARS